MSTVHSSQRKTGMTDTSLQTDSSRWRRAKGVEMLGPVSDSGLVHVTCLVQRGDGQVIQISELLNVVLASAEPTQTPAAWARKVSDAYGNELTTDGLHHLIDTKLVPLGLLEEETTEPAPALKLPKANPLLALRLRFTILPAPAARRLGAWLAPLFFPPVVVAALAGLIVVDIALFVTGDAVAALEQVLISPGFLLVLFALLTTGALIHELGHATACTYGGAKPGAIGFGVYIVFPAFFTDVTDSYRLGRIGRIRTDLGGLYFNVWCVLAAGTGYLLTGNGILLLLVIVMQIQMLQQLPPTIRLDGYFILADLAGVPDLFSRVGPVVRSLIPGRAPDPRVAELRPVARRIVTSWVVIVIPLLILVLGWTIWSLPIIVEYTVAAIQVHVRSIVSARDLAQLPDVVLAALSIFLLALPLVGLAVILTRLIVSLATFINLRIVTRREANRRKPRGPRERTPSMNTLKPPLDRAGNAPSAMQRRERAKRTPAEEPALSQGRTPPDATKPGKPVSPLRRVARASFLVEDRSEPVAADGWRGALARGTNLHVPPSRKERERRLLQQEVSRRWPSPHTVSIVNGKGGVGKTITTAMLAAVFARNGGVGVLAWDNNDTRGTLGWRTEKNWHDASVQELLPATEWLLSPAARVSDLARFVHHQTTDKYDVLRSNPELLAARQRITREQFDALHEVATKYFRMVLFDSGNDESAPRWLRMIDVTDQLVVPTTTQSESAESGALLLEALQHRDERSARLAKNAVVVVLQPERTSTASQARRIAEGFAGIARSVVIVPFDPALHGGALRFDSLERETRNAWLQVGAAVAAGLGDEHPHSRMGAQAPIVSLADPPSPRIGAEG
jgi:putative peptide zinc metalloprotease protein